MSSDGKKSASTEFVQDLLAKARAGCAESRRALLEEFAPIVRRAIRDRLHSQLRRDHDSSDFHQDVRLIFLTAKLPDGVFDSEKNFLAFVTTVVKNEILQSGRYIHTQKNDCRREVRIENMSPEDREKLVDKSPSPSSQAEFVDTWTRIDEELPVPERLTFRLLRLNYSCAEIARYLGTTERTVRRMIKRIARVAHRDLPTPTWPRRRRKQDE